MPRKNKTPKHVPYSSAYSEQSKTRYATKKDAEAAAEHRMLLHIGLTLYVYQSIADRGWYLTSKPHDGKL
jgi:hypothetical protein